MPSHARLLGARIVSEANDLKRTSDALADEIGLDRDHVRRVMRGDGGVEAAREVISRMGQRYPIDAADLDLPEDDTRHGVLVMRAETSRASSRVFDRVDRNGARSPYYEYRDTAMARLAPFRPEWIKELRVVDDDDPRNPDVVFNRGHLLHQYTLFVGPVNYYWEQDGRRFCRKMSTGDSVYITPWWPHSFASRDASQEAYILAVTFCGEVRRAQKELYTLGARASGFVLDAKQPLRALRQIVRQLMANDDIGDAELARLADGYGLDSRRIFDEDAALSWDEITALAACLGVTPGDLYVPPYDPAHDVPIRPRCADEAFDYPEDGPPSCRIERMARTPKMPFMRGSTVHVLARDFDLDRGFSTSLHAWIYNHGDVPVRIAWFDGLNRGDDTLEAGASACVRPFVRHAFASDEEGARLCVIRVPGAVGATVQRELSMLSDTTRAFAETGCWFDDGKTS